MTVGYDGGRFGWAKGATGVSGPEARELQGDGEAPDSAGGAVAAATAGGGAGVGGGEGAA